ncbi:transcriptional regulator [Ureibacillus sp. GCM10028918]|uniref:transcriptional regulator n=1 Tax=Ureibacillus sp. GCM10028918 TaxID=3273429 RepID=UPI00361CD668
MSVYRDGYDYYKQACQQYGLEPINFAYFLLSLSKEQLDAFNESAEVKRGHDLDS